MATNPLRTIDRDGSLMAARRTVVKSWHNQFAVNSINGHARAQTPFRAILGTGDFLGRVNYTCGGPTPYVQKRPGISRMIQKYTDNCDGTGIPAVNTNVHAPTRSSDYTTFKSNLVISKRYRTNV
jgi:hypothetical protein